MGWGWFIANDIQFYLLSPFILILQYKSKYLGYGALLALIVINMIITIVETIELNYNPGLIYGLLNNSQFTNSYIKPFYRMGPYLIGMIFGFIYRGYHDAIEKQEKNQEGIELHSIGDASLLPQNNHNKGGIANIEVALVK